MPRQTSKPLILIPIAAFFAILPLLLKGGSCGHDMVFHVQGWYDAAAQLRHGHYPHWSFTSAWNAGEPRFIFYPPLSWLLGALLTLILPPQAAVSTFIFLSLTLSGFTMYRLARHFTTQNAALIAAALYLANPYMLLNAFERSAFAELLAAAWIPLLLLAILRRRPTIPAIAVPLALLWLTNAPAAVMASYTLALLATLRVIQSLIKTRVQPPLGYREPSASGFISPEIQPPLGYPEPSGSGLISQQAARGFSPKGMQSPDGPLRLTLTYIAGTILGLALPAFYLIPAAYERRYIQVAMAVIPNMRIQDNFLFVRTGDPGHDGVNVQISLLAATLYILMIAAVLMLFIRAYTKRHAVLRSPASRTNNTSVLAFLSVIPGGELLLALTSLSAALLLMLTPISIPIWNHLPELHYLQFPWRILSMVSTVLAFAVALLLDRPQSTAAPRQPSPQYRFYWTALSTLILATALGFTGFHLYAQFCQPNEHPADIAALLHAHHGYQPTDEYTPNNADSDVLRAQNPGYWLIPANADPNTGAPNTLPTAAELDPSLQSDDTPIPLAQTFSETAPTHITLHPTSPQNIVLNLRDYPAWDVREWSTPTENSYRPNHITRDDGLIEIPVDQADTTTIDIRWRTTPDQKLGLALSIAALLTLFWLLLRPQSSSQSTHH